MTAAPPSRGEPTDDRAPATLPGRARPVRPRRLAARLVDTLGIERAEELAALILDRTDALDPDPELDPELDDDDEAP
jgi:hypothetical protein